MKNKRSEQNTLVCLVGHNYRHNVLVVEEIKTNKKTNTTTTKNTTKKKYNKKKYNKK